MRARAPNRGQKGPSQNSPIWANHLIYGEGKRGPETQVVTAHQQSESMPSESLLLFHSRENLKASGAEDKGSGTHLLCLVVREVGPGLEIREGAPSSPLLPPFQHPTCLLCSIQPAFLLASNLRPVQHPIPSLWSLQAGTKWQMAHIFPSILWYPTCTSRETRRPWTMVLASLIPPSQPSRDPDSVSYQKPESQGLLCKDPPSLSFLHWTFLYCSYDVQGEQFTQEAFFFFF